MEVNFLAVIVSGLVAWGLGSVWYSVLFGKAWQKELGFTDEYLKEGSMPIIFGMSMILMIIMMFGLTPVIKAHAEIDFAHGAFHGAMIGIFFCSCSMGINYLYQRRSIKLWLIDAGYQIIFLAVGGGILAIWP